MKRRVISIILAMLIVLSAFPLTAFATDGEKTISSVELVATEKLIEKYNGWYNPEENTPYFYYDLNVTKPTLKINYSDGESETVQWDDRFNYFEEIYYDVVQSVATEFTVGTHTVPVRCYLLGSEGSEWITSTLTFEILENPVESISVVANKELVENISGSYQDKYDENGEVSGQYFTYHYELADILITVNYKDEEKGSVTYTYSGNTETNLVDLTGHDLKINANQEENPFVLGDNTIKVSYLGVETDLVLTVIEDPVESISVVAQNSLNENKGGYWDYIDSEDESKGKYYVYDLLTTEPFVTVNYKNGEKLECAYGDCETIFGEALTIEDNQSGENPLGPGKHTIKAKLLGHECNFEFEIIKNPIESISVNVTEDLKEGQSGAMQDVYDIDEETGEYVIVGNYFAYQLNEATTTITINYSDSERSPETYKLYELYERFGESVEYNLNQGLNNELTVGVHTGTATFMGISCDFTFTILENPVKEISVRATKTLKENVDGVSNGEAGGGSYFVYYIENTKPEFTVKFKNGDTKVYSYEELQECGYSYDIYVEQNGYNPLLPGIHNATATFNGVTCEFTFEIVKEPIESITVRATKDLVEEVDGKFVFEDGEEYFEYDLNKLLPEITINYSDGTEKTYDYLAINKYTEINAYINSYQEPGMYGLGENTATINVAGRSIEFDFDIVRANNSQKVRSIVVAPEKAFIENHGGWFTCDYDDTGAETPEYYYYDQSNITYRVVITYEDGTTKTFENVNHYDKIDGYLFVVELEQSYSAPFKCGENTAVAAYKNAITEFKVEVAENTYTAVEISGDTELNFKLTKADGTSEIYKAVHFEPYGGDNNAISGIIETADGSKFLVDFKYSALEDELWFNDIKATFFSDVADESITSNTLQSNKWLSYASNASFINTGIANYAVGYSERFYDREFTGFNGVITGTAVDDILSISSYASNYAEYDNYGADEKGKFAILTLDEAKELLEESFDASKIDITSSPMYNAGPKEIKVYFIDFCLGDITNEQLRYINGKFVCTAEFTSEYSQDVTFPLSIEYDEKQNISAIFFTAGECSKVSTISAVNADGGVNVTYTASENAVQYEIWRSINGGEYSKIGVSDELSYFDSTASSGQTYTYKVRGINSTSNGQFSGTKTVIYLDTPTVKLTVTKSGYTVKWNKVSGAKSYIVYRAEYVNGKWSSWNALDTVKASVASFEDDTVKSGVTYKYTVRAASDAHKSYYKGTDIVVFLATPTVKIVNAKNGVRGTWNQVEGAEGYIVYRSEYSAVHKKWSGWTNLGTANGKAKSFTDKSAVSGKLYRYTLKAINGNNTSLYTASNSLLYLSEPAVTISNAKDGIAVKWTKSGGATGYRIYRSQYNATTKKWSSWKTMGTAKANKSAWVDKSVKEAVAYKYTVRAVNEKTLSSYTASASLVRLAQTNTKISTAKTGITVKWNKVSGAKGYAIYRSAFVNGKWSSWVKKSTAAANKSAWTDKSVASGVNYKYAVRAVNGASMSYYVASTQLMFLAEPSVKAVNSALGVKVTWTKISGATGYTVYSSEYNAKTKKWSAWENRGTAKANKTSWVDKKAVSGKTYKYTVRAVNGSFKSTFTASNSVLYLAQPKVTVAKSGSAVTVKWTKSAGVTGYVVYRQEKIDGNWSNWYKISTPKADKTSLTDKKLEKGKEYRYTVKAINGNVQSTFTASAAIKF